MENYEERFEHYLQGHFHPDVAPQARREVRLGHITMEAFLRLAGVFQANHEAFDNDLAVDGRVDFHEGWDSEGSYITIERTEQAQQEFDFRTAQ